MQCKLCDRLVFIRLLVEEHLAGNVLGRKRELVYHVLERREDTRAPLEEHGGQKVVACVYIRNQV